MATTGVSVTPTAIHFAGRIPDDAVRAYYTPALAVIVPSTGYETFGFVLIEAFQHGTPVIARRIGPFPEIVERCNGGELFVTREELIAAVRRLATDQSYRERLGRSARAGYQEYWTEEKVLPRYLAVVRGAASRKGNRRVEQALGTSQKCTSVASSCSGHEAPVNVFPGSG